ncbi:MAG: hypothetical protein PQJ61_12105 [Spirochaetales bacterium]|uniref:Uncharacterized protein n=1 Tax=Candidatus Thalassospirochaeta sargassi TaxID=3119039 RepID=A0AAJ1IGH8_9SPIO|nr:hypothetical protein [Spirochaetales bacterium]
MKNPVAVISSAVVNILNVLVAVKTASAVVDVVVRRGSSVTG